MNDVPIPFPEVKRRRREKGPHRSVLRDLSRSRRLQRRKEDDQPGGDLPFLHYLFGGEKGWRGEEESLLAGAPFSLFVNGGGRGFAALDPVAF